MPQEQDNQQTQQEQSQSKTDDKATPAKQEEQDTEQAYVPKAEYDLLAAQISDYKRRLDRYEAELFTTEPTVTPAPKKGEASTSEAEPEPDYETMDAKRYARYVREQARKDALEAMETKLNALRQEVVSRDQAAAVAEQVREWNALRASQKDAESYRPVMVELSTRHPSLSVTELYHLAKGLVPTAPPLPTGSRPTVVRVPSPLKPGAAADTVNVRPKSLRDVLSEEADKLQL